MTDILDGLERECKEYKTDLCTENGGPADGQPFILGTDLHGEHFLIPDTLDGHPTDNLPIILNAILGGLAEKNGTLRWNWLAYVVEGYANDGDKTMLDNFERGSFEQDFRNNPSSKVKEALIVTVFTWEGESACRTLLYHYGDDGMPVWGEPMDAVEQPQGAIPFTFETFRIFCENEGDMTKLMETIGFPPP